MKIKENIRLIVISMISGITAVIPGISGGTIFAVFNISEELTASIKELTKFRHTTFWKNLRLPLIIGIGSYLSSLLYANLLIEYIDKLQYFIAYLFIGLIVFSLPILWKEATEYQKAPNNQKLTYILFFVGLIIALIMYNIGSDEVASTNYDMSIFEYIRYTIVSMFAGVTTILPGISGTNIMILFGEYDNYIHYSADFFTYLLPNLVFVIGTIIGTIISSYILTWLFTAYKSPFFAVITGLTASTIYVLAINPFVGWGSLLQSMIGFALGYLLINQAQKSAE